MSTHKTMIKDTIYYRTKLPHIHPADGIFFITFRLVDSLPKSVLNKFMIEKEAAILHSRLENDDIINKELKYNIEKKYFDKFDQLLKNGAGKCWLKQPKIAQLVSNKIHSYDPTRYKLMCYCIMPNHVHLLIEPNKVNLIIKSNKYGASRNYYLTETLRLLKGSTARLCNNVLDRTGVFWQHESYDHYIRNEREFIRTIRYILYNPVKAGFVDDWRDWEFNYLADL